MSFALRFARNDVRIHDDRAVFEGYFSVRKLSIEHRGFNGDWCPLIQREVFERGNAVGVLPYDPASDTLILIEQFRAGALGDVQSPWMLELIAGIIEERESDEAVVRRESQEEAGCVLDELEPIASYYPSAGACTEHVRLYCGRVLSADVGAVRGLDSEGEDILVHRLPVADVFDLLRDDQINNGHTLVALQWLALNREPLRQRWLAAHAP